jgi:hypothetical protein
LVCLLNGRLKQIARGPAASATPPARTTPPADATPATGSVVTPQLPAGAFHTEEGCNTVGYAVKWASENITRMRWTGACLRGLAEGQGTLIVEEKNGSLERFVGGFAAGEFTSGDYYDDRGIHRQGTFHSLSQLSGKRWREDGTLQLEGTSFYPDGTMREGKVWLATGLLDSDGTYYLSGRLQKGKSYWPNGGYVDGEFTDTEGKLNFKTGEGIVRGKYYGPDGSVTAVTASAGTSSPESGQ